MSTSKIFMLRPSFRAAYRYSAAQLIRPLGRRSYATMQERVASSSDRPWQIAAVGVTIPGLMYLRKGAAPEVRSGGQEVHGAGHVQHAAPAPEAPKAKSVAEPPKSSEQKVETIESANPSDSESEASMTPSSSGDSESQGLVGSLESQAEKLADKAKAAARSVNPTQK